MEAGRSEGMEAGRSEGMEAGRAKGMEEGLARAIEGVCEVLGIPLGPSERGQMQALDAAGLDALFAELKTRRCWPSPAPRRCSADRQLTSARIAGNKCSVICARS
jgi:hypothetical protein